MKIAVFGDSEINERWLSDHVGRPSLLGRDSRKPPVSRSRTWRTLHAHYEVRRRLTGTPQLFRDVIAIAPELPVRTRLGRLMWRLRKEVGLGKRTQEGW